MRVVRGLTVSVVVAVIFPLPCLKDRKQAETVKNVHCLYFV